MVKKRNYRREYLLFQSSTKSKKDRASRNKVRRQLLRSGRVTKGDNRDAHHVDGNPRNNSSRNVRITSRRYNRAKH